jgi:hypothetical protein
MAYPPITYTIFNNSSTVATVTNFTFTTPAEIYHISTLTNFGVPGTFTGTSTNTNTIISPNSTASFISFYGTNTGVLGTYTGTVDITARLPFQTQHLTVTNIVINSLNPIPNPNNRVIIGGGVAPPGGGGGGNWDIVLILISIAVGDCFTPDTDVLMADGTIKKIVDVQVGEQVYNRDRSSINTVKFLEIVPDTHWSHLYSPNPKIEPFATVNHPLYIKGVLSSVNPEAQYLAYPWLDKAAKLEPSKMIPTENKLVYNLWVDGDGTYIVNGYGTTSIMGDGGWLSQSHTDGYLTHPEALMILNNHCNNGRALRVGSYHINRLLKWIDFKPLSKLMATTLLKEKSILKTIFITAMRAVGLVANLIYRIRK